MTMYINQTISNLTNSRKSFRRHKAPHLERGFGENLPGLRADHLDALLHEDGLLEEAGELVGPAGVPRVEVPPQELGALLHQGWQHVPGWIHKL